MPLEPEDEVEREERGDLSDVQPKTPPWLEFERDIAQHLTMRFDDVAVTHNAKHEGHFSHRLRQIDVLVEGTVAGSPITIIVECKRNPTTRLGIGVVDAFVGKLLDLGAEKGVLWAFGDFDAGARARATGALNPKIELRTLADARDNTMFTDELFSPADCPNSDCFGDVSWYTLEQQDPSTTVSTGTCHSCGQRAGRCPECGEITALDGSTTCYGCGGRWDQYALPNAEEEIHWSPLSV